MKGIILSVSILAATAGAAPRLTRAADLQITQQERVLAQLLQGHWIENAYYTQEDCSHLCAFQFGCSPLVSDCPFSDQLGDADKLQVIRTYRNFSGGTSHVETVVLKPEQYWSLVKLVEDRFAQRKASKGKDFMPFAVYEPLEFYGTTQVRQ